MPIEAVRPLRLAYLRPGQPEAAVAYHSDDCETCEHYGVRAPDGQPGAGEVLAVGSLHRDNRVAGQPPHHSPGIRIRGMAVLDTRRKEGLGLAVARRLVERARELEAAEVWANARSDTLAFYRRIGLERVSAEFDIPTIGPHVVMALALKG